MKWFNGTISEAIRTSRDKKIVFVVVITSEDDESHQLLETLEKEEVVKVFNSFVCISLKHGSSEANQFHQLYPIVILPVIYFIGLQGSPIEIIGGAVDVKSLLARSTAALELHLKQHNLVSEEDAANASNSLHPVSPSEIAASGSHISAELGADLMEVEKVSESPNMNSPSESPDQSLNTVPERKKEKRQKEEPLREQELKESETSIKKFKSKTEEPESCEVSQSYQEQKATENKEAVLRKRVVENKTSIDKSGSKTHTSDQEKSKLEKKSPVNPTDVNAQPGRTETRNEVTRLQFRLPDGSTRTEIFPSNVNLSKIVEFINSQIKPPFNSYSLCTTFPRREFADMNMQQTLLELDLTPSSALLIVPRSPSYNLRPISGQSSVSSYLQKILVPFYWVWNFIWVSISSLIPFPSTPIQPSTGDGQSTNQRNSADQRVRPPRSNIHRLPNPSSEDSSDENGTWNGNSTQQL